MTAVNPLATDHLPMFITAPGQTDVLMVVMWMVFIAAILGAGVFFFWLHSLPERMVHNKIQFDIVAVLALLSLFTHQHAFWVAALLIALITLPDFSFPDFSSLLGRIAKSLESIAARPVEEPSASEEDMDDQKSKPAQQKTAEVIFPKPKPAHPKVVADSDGIVTQANEMQPAKHHKREG